MTGFDPRDEPGHFGPAVTGEDRAFAQSQT